MIRRTLLASALLAVLALPSPVDAAPERADNYVMAGGGTAVSNGVFFPGTALYDEQTKEFTGEPYTIERGTDLTLVMGDAAEVANGHRMVSFKKRRGIPLFSSKMLRAPGDRSLVVTSNLKPGVYPYYCPIHFGMYGLLEVE